MTMPAVILSPLRDSALFEHLPEKWWNSFFESSEDAQTVCRRDGVAVSINLKAARLLKINRNAIEGYFSIFDVLLPSAGDKLRELLRSSRTHSDVLHSATIVSGGHPNGFVDLELLRLDENHTLVTFKDVARRMRLESHVNRLVTAIDATPDVFFLTDAEGRITFVNPAFHSVTGYDIETVLDRTDEFLRAPSEEEKVREYLDLVNQGREWIGELTNIRRDGTAYVVEATISPISDMTGQFIGYVACERDITTRKNLESDLRCQHNFVRSILQSLDGAIYSLDREFKITHANEGWRRLPAEHGGIRLDGPPETGRSLLDYIPDAGRRAELIVIFQEVLSTGQAQDNRFQTNESHWLLKISPWIHEGQVRGLICNVADHTRYHELQNQLFQSQKMEIIGTLAAGVAHDFNNLLQAIRGNTSLLMMQAPQESDVHHWGEQINLAATRASEITRQLLSFSRRTDSERAILDLNQIIQDAGDLAHRTLRANVNLKIAAATQAVPIKIELTRATQALLNLCVNAQDAMPDGGTLTIASAITTVPAEVATRQKVSIDVEFARCSVTDTGSGIPADLLPRIFEAFFSTKEKGRGTGLGLSIVNRIMQEADGFIDVETALGKGTTFHLYFPLSRENVTARTPSADAPLLPRAKGRVLVVDDLDLLRDFAVTFLEAAGMTVFVAASGKEALQLLEKENGGVDILFTDFAMPGMNGADLIEQVSIRWPHIRPLLASGYLEERITTRLQELNARILFKPYEMHEAAKILVELLQK